MVYSSSDCSHYYTIPYHTFSSGELLRLMGADGVAVIVSRWFGGTLLGPDRFKFISNAARRLLEEKGVGHGGKHVTTGSGFATKR